MQVLRTSILSRPRRFAANRPPVIQPARWRNKTPYKKSKLRARRPDPRQVASVLLLAAGGMLCSYVVGSYAWMYAEQKKLLQEWKSGNPSKSGGATALADISIPRIGLQAVVLEGATRHSLLLGPAHMAGTAIPGTLGNAVIAGHRDTFFRRIHSLRYGDDIYIRRSGKRFRYLVVRKKVVEASNLSVLGATRDGELTLITCYPTHVIGPAPRRLIVVARMISGGQKEKRDLGPSQFGLEPGFPTK
jgi:LPXTG-site transpeptidase (sortase) family protein